MKTYYFVLLIDAILLVAVFYVVGDIQWRVADAGSPHGRTSGYSTSFTYSVFTQVFTMTGKGVVLSSPPTLDWVQVLAVALLVVNGWFLYSVYAGRKNKPAAPASPVQSPTPSG